MHKQLRSDHQEQPDQIPQSVTRIELVADRTKIGFLVDNQPRFVLPAIRAMKAQDRNAVSKIYTHVTAWPMAAPCCLLRGGALDRSLECWTAEGTRRLAEARLGL